MNQNQLVMPNSFCWNQACPDYGKINHGNIRKFGKTRKGTVFHRRHHSSKTILECLALLAECNSLAALHRVKGIKEETISEWLCEAAKHVEEVERLLLAKLRADPGPIRCLVDLCRPQG